MQVAIIGGGLTGIFAARVLQELGHEPLIIEKSRSVGGRLATRRINGGRADHGAQFFTVRSTTLQSLVEDWEKQGIVRRWFGDDHPRYMAPNGMNGLAKDLSQDLQVILDERVVHAEYDAKGGVTIGTDNGELYMCDAMIMTAPVPQALELLENSVDVLDDEVADVLRTSAFHSCFVGLFELEEPFTVGDSGILDSDLPEGIDKVIANDQKGISDTPLLSVYMTGEWSDKRFDWEDTNVMQMIEEQVAKLELPEVVSAQLKRWRYAEAISKLDEPYMELIKGAPLYIAGDSFLRSDDSSGRTRVESAILSGIEVGEAVNRYFLPEE
ncbi:FAD-dependent oxidoreductase [Paenalkalicoccus suaedae]|uniref:FAD-dependent oxidoreductase n=1 Tax=Paenalkalicoccus suaedae TaxID=2592382 RepID=A0A859FA71_9BACI|nr:FAD-dependent oxidoreductase [Paenalkalicoccus suaedae]QKS70099.1 FAD-dependent oxidoreductase [Paenalkalicoccus suaedae]